MVEFESLQNVHQIHTKIHTQSTLFLHFTPNFYNLYYTILHFQYTTD